MKVVIIWGFSLVSDMLWKYGFYKWRYNKYDRFIDFVDLYVVTLLNIFITTLPW